MNKKTKTEQTLKKTFKNQYFLLNEQFFGTNFSNGYFFTE